MFGVYIFIVLIVYNARIPTSKSCISKFEKTLGRNKYISLVHSLNESKNNNSTLLLRFVYSKGVFLLTISDDPRSNVAKKFCVVLKYTYKNKKEH